MERRERLREYRWSSYRSYAGLEKRKSFLESEPIQGVFQTYTGRRCKSWEYRRWVEEGLGPRQSVRAPPNPKGNIFSYDFFPQLDGLETQFMLLLGDQAAP
jgi:hypothetical protein